MSSYEGGDSYYSRGRRGRRRGGRGYRGGGRQSSTDWYGRGDESYQEEYTDNHDSRRLSTPPPPPPPVQHRSNDVSIVNEGWQYRDPEGMAHGPFLAAKIANWVDKGFFSGGLEVRKVGARGAGAWTKLEYVLADVRREAALTLIPEIVPPSATATKGAPPPPPQHDEGGRGNGRGRGGRGGFSNQYSTQSSDASPSGAPHPPQLSAAGAAAAAAAAAATAPRPSPLVDSPFYSQQQYPQYPSYRGGRDSRGRGGRRTPSHHYEGGPMGDGRAFGDRYDSGRGFGGRGRGRDFPGRGGGIDGRGGFPRGGRGMGRGGGGGRPTAEEQDVLEAVRKLFTGEVQQGAEQPMWRYIDYEGIMQGPFPAKSMEDWYNAGYLSDSSIRICGTERKVSPPNLPPPEFFIPLGALIYWIRRGHQFTPITVADIQSGQLPDDLQKLKDGAEKIARGGKREGEDKGGEAHEEKKDEETTQEPKASTNEEEDINSLAKSLVNAAVSAVLAAHGQSE